MTVDVVSPWEAAARLFEPPPPKPRRWPSPLDMACDLDRTIIRTPALGLINRKLVELADQPGQGRLATFLSPQEGKSTLCSFWNPLWLLVDNPDRRVLIISYGDDIARRWGADIKRALETFNGDEGAIDLGLRLRADSKAAGRWNIEGHRGGVVCAGIGGQITGRPGDVIVVDDPLKNLEEAQSAKYRDRGLRTWQGTLVPRMAPHTKVFWIQTLWHESEPIQQILANEGDDWEVIRIPAICDSPDDPLGRQIGEPMVSARGTGTGPRSVATRASMSLQPYTSNVRLRPRVACSSVCGGGTGRRHRTPTANALTSPAGSAISTNAGGSSPATSRRRPAPPRTGR
jgi:hypothetical protein